MTASGIAVVTDVNSIRTIKQVAFSIDSFSNGKLSGACVCFIDELTRDTYVELDHHDFTSVSFPNLTVSNGLIVFFANPLMSSASFPKLAQIGDGDNVPSFVLSGSLASFSLPSLSVVKDQAYLDFSGNALDQTSVNGLLVAINSTRAVGATGTLKLEGGSNAAPSGAGITAKTALTNAGWTVSTN